MSSLGTLPVLQIHSLRIPPAGGWWCDLALDGNTLPSVGSLLPLTVGDLVLLGTITESGYDDHPVGGARPRLTLEGGAGWGKPVARQGAYGPVSPGVRLSTVLRDLAALAAEPYDAPAEFYLAPSYGWPASSPREAVTGRTVLSDLMTRGAIPTWRVDPASGHTRFDLWPSTGAADAFGRVMRRNLRAGVRVVGLDVRVATFLPGATLEGVPVARLHITETSSKLMAEVYAQ
jgi:hypothetical protein